MKKKETILILGGTGFIGKNLINYFLENASFSYSQIIVLSRKNHDNHFDNVIYEYGDYGDKEVLIKLFTKWNFTKVFHLATSTTPVSSNQNIIEDLNGNLIASIGLLDVMYSFGCKYILYLSSGGAVYGEKDSEVVSESEVCSPISSYGVVKLTIENYLKLYQKQFGIHYLILRVSNPFGEFHNSEIQGIINIASRRAIKGEAIEVWGDGTQSKDYIYIYDLVKIIFQLVENKIINKTINVGFGQAFQLNLILDKIKLNFPEFKINYIASKPTDIKNFCLDISLLQSLINFEFTNLDEAIRNTILWEKMKI